MAEKALATVAVRHQVYLERLKSGEAEKFAAFLTRMDRGLRESLAGPNLTDFRRSRIEKQLSGVDKLLKGEFEDYRSLLARDLEEIANYEAEFEGKSIDAVAADKTFESVLPSEGQIRAAVFSRPLSIRGADGGKLLDDFVKDWTIIERRKIVGAIRQGAFEGQTNSQIIQAIRGTRKNQFRDGILQTTTRNAEAIVRTSVQHVSGVARAETWTANADIIKGYRIVATLDSRTSTVCRSLDGEVFKLDKGPKPPFHIRCRTTTIAELVDEFSDLSEGRTRATQDGPVSAKKSYYDWLKDQPAEFQDDILGPVRGKLFRDGGLSAERFAKLNLGRNFRPLTLDEMKKREPQAFLKAFGGESPKPKAKRPAPESKPVKNSRFNHPVTGPWNRASFEQGPEWLQKVVEGQQFVDVQVGKDDSAYAQFGRLIYMGNYQPSDAYGQAVWRHEFGHIVDVRKGDGWYRSSRQDFLKAREADSDALKTAVGKGRKKKAGKANVLAKNAAYREIGYAVDERGFEAVKEAIEFADLDQEGFIRALRSGTEILDGIDDIEKAPKGVLARIGRLVEAIRYNDPQEFIYRALEMEATDFASSRRRWRRDGSFAMLSDLVGSCTKNQVCNHHDGYSGHSNAYYSHNNAKAPTEGFANLFAMAGHPEPYWWQIVKRFTPNMAKEFERIMKE